MSCGVRVIAVFAAFVVVQAAPAEEFVWTFSGQLVGRLNVPTGFVVETYDYREGIVTTLRYSDGAYVVLQAGGMYRIPLFQDKENKLISSRELSMRTIRVGQFTSTELWWREDDYKPK